MESVIGYSWQTQNCIKQNIRRWAMVYIKLSISIWQSPKKATFFCKPSGNIANHGNMFIVFKCHPRSLICILYDGIYWRVFQPVHTHFPNTFHSFVKPLWISQRSSFRWSCGVDNPQGQTHSIKMKSLALSLCCFLSSSLTMKAGNSSSNTQIFTACPELRCLLLPYQLPLDFGTKLDTSNHSRRSMIFMSKQKGFSVLILAEIQVIPRWFAVPAPIYTPDPLGKGQVCMGRVTARSWCHLNTPWPILRQRGRRREDWVKQGKHLRHSQNHFVFVSLHLQQTLPCLGCFVRGRAYEIHCPEMFVL